MEQSFEEMVPLPAIIIGFIVLFVLSNFLRKKLRKSALVREGQVFGDGGRIVSIEERLAANKEWASGEIRSRDRGLMLAVWLVTIVWSLTFGVSFIKGLSNPEFKTPALIVLGLFTAGGIPFLVFAIRLTLRQLKFSGSICKIQGKAGVLGKVMTGRIVTKKEIAPKGDYTIQIQCIETYHTGSGKNRRSENKIHWQDNQSVPSAGKSSVSGIPFSFALPTIAHETGYQLARGKINWQISMRAPVEGVDYSAMFVVPVFKMD